MDSVQSLCNCNDKEFCNSESKIEPSRGMSLGELSGDEVTVIVGGVGFISKLDSGRESQSESDEIFVSIKSFSLENTLTHGTLSTSAPQSSSDNALATVFVCPACMCVCAHVDIEVDVNADFGTEVEDENGVDKDVGGDIDVELEIVCVVKMMEGTCICPFT